MKKTFVVILLASFFGEMANAQTTTVKKKLDWGLTTGLNISNLRVNNGQDAGWKTGLAAGVFFNFKTGDKVAVQPQFLYSSMGGKNIYPGTDNSLRLNYFSLPVLLKYKISNCFAVVAGPQIDVLITAKTKNSINQFAKVTDSYKEDSYNATAGFELWPSHCFGFTVRYIYGFNNISNTSAAGNPELKNQGVQLMASLKL